MERSLIMLMAVSGAVLGFFIAFSRDPVAGAVIGGILSTVTAIGLFFISAREQGSNQQALVRATSTAMLWFYGFLVGVTCLSLLVDFWLPSNLDIKRNEVSTFLNSSGIKSVNIGDTGYVIPAQSREAATALLIATNDLSKEATPIKVFATGTATPAPEVSVNVGKEYCDSLKKMLVSSPTDISSLKDFGQFTNNLQARLAGVLLEAISDKAQIVVLGKKVQQLYCKADVPK
jgi:hypothetical protein